MKVVTNDIDPSKMEQLYNTRASVCWRAFTEALALTNGLVFNNCALTPDSLFLTRESAVT